MLAIMEPLNDSEIERVLVVVAHPDDCDFGAAGTTALWSAKGIKVSYCKQEARRRADRGFVDAVG